MTTTSTTTKTPGYNIRIEVFFSTDKRGRKVAYYMSFGRAIRMSLANAELFVAADQATLLPGHPLKSL